MEDPHPDAELDAELLRPALEVVGRADGVRRVAAMYMVALCDQELLFFGDTAVNINPDAEALTDIALLTAGFVENLFRQARLKSKRPSNDFSLFISGERGNAEMSRTLRVNQICKER